MNQRQFNRMLALAITAGMPTLAMAAEGEQDSGGHTGDTVIPATSSKGSTPRTNELPIGPRHIAMVVYPHFVGHGGT